MRTRSDDYIHNYPEILDLKVNAKSGIYDVVGLTNWRNEKAARHIEFDEKLGLSAGSYVVFDYWKQELLGVFKNGLDIEIDPHDTRVLLIHPLLNQPQLIGISRHITGAYSVLNVSWDAAKNTLRGSSETVPGAPYAMWFYVPNGVLVSKVTTRPEFTSKRDGNALMVSFSGQQQPVDWQVQFTTR
jgi:hypothetical protein